MNTSYTPYAERKGAGAINVKTKVVGLVVKMAAYQSVSSRLSEKDIPGASLQGRNPATLKSDELRFWLNVVAIRQTG